MPPRWYYWQWYACRANAVHWRYLATQCHTEQGRASHLAIADTADADAAMRAEQYVGSLSDLWHLRSYAFNREELSRI